MSKIRIVLADDHAFLLEACKKMLEPEFEVPAVFTDGRTLLEAAPALRPDAIVIDIGMPLLNGLDAGRQLKKLMPAVKLIFLTMYRDPDLANEAIRAGASAYLLKTSAASELLKAIHEALKGRLYVTPAIAGGMEDSFIRNPEGRHASKDLTPRQREVLQLLAEGRPMKEAAYILSVSTRTIAFHKYRMMEQLGIRSSAELIQFAVNQHVVPQQPEFARTGF
jgi:DNA-binding NarL/FixJ family response regulator